MMAHRIYIGVANQGYCKSLLNSNGFGRYGRLL